MLRKRKKILAQSTLEYAVLIVLVVTALLATQVYIKRAIHGRMKSSADDIGDQISFQSGNVKTTVNSFSQTNEVVSGGVTTSNLLKPETTSRKVNVDLGNYEQNEEFWGK